MWQHHFFVSLVAGRAEQELRGGWWRRLFRLLCVIVLHGTSRSAVDECIIVILSCPHGCRVCVLCVVMIDVLQFFYIVIAAAAAAAFVVAVVDGDGVFG